MGYLIVSDMSCRGDSYTAVMMIIGAPWQPARLIYTRLASECYWETTNVPWPKNIHHGDRIYYYDIYMIKMLFG